MAGEGGSAISGGAPVSAIPNATFISASPAVSTYVKIAGPKAEAARFWVTTPAGAGNDPVIEVALVVTDGGVVTVLGRFRATCTATAKRTGSDGASGDYVCNVAFDEGGSSRLDLLAFASDLSGKSAEWKVGVVDLDSQASAKVYWSTSEKV